MSMIWPSTVPLYNQILNKIRVKLPNLYKEVSVPTLSFPTRKGILTKPRNCLLANAQLLSDTETINEQFVDTLQICKDPLALSRIKNIFRKGVCRNSKVKLRHLISQTETLL